MSRRCRARVCRPGQGNGEHIQWIERLIISIGCLAQSNVPESLSNLAWGPGCLGKPKGSFQALKTTAQALIPRQQRWLALACERVGAFAKDRQEWGAAQHHHLAVNRSHLAPAKFAETQKCAPNGG
jgi:hypothetical protein